MSAPRFVDAYSTDPELVVAEERTVGQLLERLGGPPDLLLFFATHHHAAGLQGLGERLSRATGAQGLAGCTGASCVSGSLELEQEPALVLWGARFAGDLQIRIDHITASATEEGGIDFAGIPEVEQPHRAGMVLLADPFTFPAQAFLPRFEVDLPGVPVVGGFASGGQGPRQNLLWQGETCHDHGALAITLEGDVVLETVVSQGCRPVGDPLVITKCEGPVIHSLRGKRADQVLFDVLAGLSEEDRNLFRRGAQIGLAIDASRSEFGAEDLLVRLMRGVDPSAGTLIVGDDSIRTGMSVQFMVRDAESATNELHRLLSERPRIGGGDAGALLFTCGGRGAHLFRELHHDAAAIQQHLGPDLPLAGFFAAGEIGPVSGRTCMHGFTASIGLIVPRDE